MNFLTEFVSMIETGLTLSDFKVLADNGKRDKYSLSLRATNMHNLYKRTDDKFLWYLSLTIDEADKLFFILQRKVDENQNTRKEKKEERRQE